MPRVEGFIYWLAQAAKAAREAHGLKPRDIAVRANLDQSSVYRFEDGASWPRDPDDYINAYAAAIGLPDARDLWSAALDLWRIHGTPPTLPQGHTPTLAPEQTLARVMADVGQASQQGAGGSSATPRTRAARGRRAEGQTPRQ